MNANEPVAWKAYEEVNFNDQYTMRWVRVGDEYVNKITKEMMEDLKSVVRQQQAEIEALKQIIDANNLNQNIGQFVKPANEPVAWMHQNPEYPISKHWSQEYNIPLYTHPVKEQDESFDRTASHMAGEYVSHPVKDLEDIDINITWNENSMRDFGKDELAFARAILRKAQE